MPDDSAASTSTTSTDQQVDVPPDPNPLFGSRSPGSARHDADRDRQPARGEESARPQSPSAQSPRADAPRGQHPATPAAGTGPGATTDTTTMPPVDADRATRDAPASGGPIDPDLLVRPEPHDDRGSSGWWWVAVPLVLLLVVLGWVGWLFNERAGTAMPGVTVEGVDASGMDADQITAAMDEIVASRQNAPITVTAADEEYTFQLGPEGYQADVPATVDAALSAGRDGLVGSARTHVRASLGDPSWTIPLAGVDVDEGVDDFLAQVDDDIDLEPTSGSVSLDAESLEVTSETPQEGYDADTEAVRAELVALLGTGEAGSLTVPVETIPPLVDPADVEQTVERATAVLADSYVLRAGDDSVTVDPSEIAPLLSIDETGDGYALDLDGGGVVELLSDGRGDKFAVSPKSATYEVASSRDRTFDDKGSATFDPSPATVDLIEGRTGLEFNPQVAGELLVSLFEQGEHEGEFELDVVEPNFSTEEAEAAQPDALLGTFTTYHEAGGERVFNIHLLADMIDGEVLPPGDDFSVNRDIGDRNEEKGFKAAGAIKDGEIIDDDIGGGVSQLATTFYNAAFFAGIDVLAWQPHSLPIDRYPMAREATFSYLGGLDIHILNDTEGGLVVTTDYTDTSITVSIYGKDDGREVSAIMGEPHDYTDFDVVRRTTDEIPDGQTRTVQTGAEGFTVDYERVIKGGTTPGRESYKWAYSPKPTIIETGTG